LLISLVIAAALMVLFYRYLRAAPFHELPDRSLALAVDKAHPELHGQIAAAVQFARGEVGMKGANSPALVKAVMADACDVAPSISFMTVLNHRRARHRAIELAIIFLANVAAVAISPELTKVWFQRNWLLQDVPWPQATHITPIGFDQDGRRRMPRGDELEIAAENEGRVPASVGLRWWTPSGRRGTEPMTLIGSNRWETLLGVLTEDVYFRIVGGDERTREYVVEAVDRPRVVHTTVRVTPPEYTALDPQTFEQETVLEILHGSTLEIEAALNRPVGEARFVGAGGEAAPCERPASDRLRVTWERPISGSYAFELLDRDGWNNRRPVRYTLKVVPDQPPDARLDLVDVGESVTPAADLPIELECEDTYGLSAVTLYVQRGVDPPFEIPLEGFEPGVRMYSVETRCEIASFNVAAGDRLRFWAEARDEDPTGGNVGQSEPFDVRVVSRTDFLAELAGRELELRREFERLISAQRGLKDALDRLLPEMPVEGATPSALAQRLAGLARRQESHAKSCLAIRRRFEQVLAEMQINKVARAGDERRIGERVITPLGRLGERTMPAAVVEIGELGRAADLARAETLPKRQAYILRDMRAILANMLEWEGYREAVVLLQEIIDEQRAVRSATIEALEQQLEDILGLDEVIEEDAEEPPRP